MASFQLEIDITALQRLDGLCVNRYGRDPAYYFQEQISYILR